MKTTLMIMMKITQKMMKMNSSVTEWLSRHYLCQRGLHPFIIKASMVAETDEDRIRREEREREPLAKQREAYRK